ncbi:MAG: hypothetical protein QOK25_889 [Thermoleophilaceae bacterium]|nr:hypothetical protein [Thermoleophilaceae bacterium]
MTAAAATGWAMAGVLGLVVLALRRRLRLVADAEHELRGPITAFALGLGTRAEATAAPPLADALASELARARLALDDLTAARVGRRAVRTASAPVALERLVCACAEAWRPAHGGRAVEVDWAAGSTPVRTDAGRVAQVLGNLVSNAVEHGAGPVGIRARRLGGAVKVEVSNRAPSEGRPRTGGRGRGLRIAARASRQAGGALRVGARAGQVAAVLDLPGDE